MSMRGQIISKEYQRMEWIQDKDGRELACYRDDVEGFDSKRGLTEEQKKRCLDASQVVGDTW
ncbi:hypothetical protein [Desulfosediminicola flagellatus]|uniref:hypothetical protein n=1 Tax=Desulfosediminicola flagellatus TaxID=2569541 RepID=UPI001E5E4E5A|nr:hypothetical protein [Desulfosediminicola flagellatus]